MNESEVKYSPFLNFLPQLKPIEDAFVNVRKKSWEKFFSLGLPAEEDSLFHGVKLSKLYLERFSLSESRNLSQEQIDPFVLPQCKNSFVVIINGFFCSQLSNVTAFPSKVIISSIEEGFRAFGTYLINSELKSVKDESDPFVCLNSACYPQGMFVYVPPKTILSTPLQILHFVIENDTSHLCLPKTHIFVGTHSVIEIIRSHHHTTYSNSRYFVNQMTEIHIEENALVRHQEYLDDERPTSWHFNSLRVTLKKESAFHSVSYPKGSVGQRISYRVFLLGEYAKTFINGLSLLSDNRESFVNIFVDHLAPNCMSKQHFKSVLNDNARFGFNGKIRVQPEAYKIEALQYIHNLLLSDSAHVDIKPHMEILEDDVKASHGVTVGGLDKDQMFYLMTRGLSQETAKRLLIKGFCETVLNV